MNGTNQKYDIICSLGGNCSVAHNLRYRKKRPFSLPFDWVYMENETPLIYLQEGFKDHFKNLALRKNLKQIPATAEHSLIYYDSYSGYYFPNHFVEPLNDENFLLFKNTLHRRTERLLSCLTAGKSALFVFAGKFMPSTIVLVKLHKQLTALFPNCHIVFKIIVFNFKEKLPAAFHNDIEIIGIARPFNDYDFYSTNYDAWHWMDDIEWNLPAYKEKDTSVSRQLFSIHFFSYKLRLLLQKGRTKPKIR